MKSFEWRPLSTLGQSQFQSFHPLTSAIWFYKPKHAKFPSFKTTGSFHFLFDFFSPRTDPPKKGLIKWQMNVKVRSDARPTGFLSLKHVPSTGFVTIPVTPPTTPCGKKKQASIYSAYSYFSYNRNEARRSECSAHASLLVTSGAWALNLIGLKSEYSVKLRYVFTELEYLQKALASLCQTRSKVFGWSVHLFATLLLVFFIHTDSGQAFSNWTCNTGHHPGSTTLKQKGNVRYTTRRKKEKEEKNERQTDRK